jgi:hypothetical protein
VPSLTSAGCLTAAYVFALLFFSPSSFADRDTDSGCTSRDRSFATELATLHALSACYAAHSADEDREYFAAILRNPDGFVFVVDAGRHGVDEVSLRFTPLRGEVFVALWHTHGARGLNRELFSPTDTALVKRMRVPFYLTDPKGVLRVFRPGDRVRAPRRDRSTVRAPSGAATGTVLAANILAARSGAATRAKRAMMRSNRDRDAIRAALNGRQRLP